MTGADQIEHCLLKSDCPEPMVPTFRGDRHRFLQPLLCGINEIQKLDGVDLEEEKDTPITISRL